jgi:hypothetical protein
MSAAIDRLRDYLAGRRTDLNPGDLDDVLGELDRRGTAIGRVRELHSPDKYEDCPGCGFTSDEESWPWTDCRTIAALDGES